MNDTLINNLNELVKENDILYNLGDFAFGPLKEIGPIRQRINCKTIHLICGNHDRKSAKKAWFKELFTTIKTYDEIKHNGHKIVLCHYALRVWNQSHYGSFMFFGHSHGNLPDNGTRSLDVGVDCHNYKPVSLDWAIEYLSNRQVDIIK